MTEVRDQRSAVRNQRPEINRRDAGYAGLFLCAFCASLVKPISDLRLLIAVLCAVLFALCLPVQAQQPAKIPRIGLLYASASGNAHRVEAFRQGLRELGYVEGKNIVIEYRYPDGKRERFSEYATELVRLKVDIIVTGGGSGTRPAKEATSTIPIVMSQDDDPVGNGFVASLARPGGNITGLATLSPELSGKRLELLKEAVSRLSRVAVFLTPSSQDDARALKEVELAAGVLGVKLQHVEVLDSQRISSLRSVQQARAGRRRCLVSCWVRWRRRAEHRLPNSR
jgi:putative ABC transport system substrate-binding protein